MNKINKLTFGTLAALIAALCFQSPLMGAANEAASNEGDHGVAKITFVKYVNVVLNQPGLIATMTGVGEGDAGDVLFEGEVLQQGTVPPSGRNVVAFYHFTGTKHSFSALIRGLTPVAGIGLKGYIVGVVTSGWLKGHALEGEWTVIPATYAPGTGFGNSFAVTLTIKHGVND